MDVYDEIRAEQEHQLQKWGIQNHDAGMWMLILGEEVGEAAQSALKQQADHYRAELVQVAAVAVSMLQSFDRVGMWPGIKPDGLE